MRRSVFRAMTVLAAGAVCGGFAATVGCAQPRQDAGATTKTAEAPKAEPATKPLSVIRVLVDKPDERVCVLSDGLTVIVKAHRAAPVVSVRMYCRTGSVYEQEYGGTGISHLFEHLLHGGATIRRTEAESEQELLELGDNTNAYTSFDVTCYFINTARDNLARAVDLVSDWITHPTFPDEAFHREWGVVQRELERDVDDPSRQLWYMMMELMYPGHPARFPIIGYQQAVQTLRKEDIVNYYKRMYVPDNVVVAIAGDIDLDAAVQAVETSFASFSRRPVRTIDLPRDPDITAPRSSTRVLDVQAAVLQLSWPSIRLTDPDLYALDVLSFILTQGESSRLLRSIVREKQLAYSADSFSWTPEWVRGVFAITLRLDPEKIGEATDAVWEEVRRVQTELVSDDELAQAKRQKTAEHVLSHQTAEDFASSMASDFISTGDPHFSDDYVARIQKVTPEQVRDVARRYLVPQRTGTVRILPSATKIAHTETPTSESSPAKKITLDNGLRVVIRRDTSSPSVAINLYAIGGLVCEDADDNGISNMMAELMLRGTKTRSADEIARFFDSRGATISAGSGNNTFYVQCEALRDDIEPVLDVFADVVLNPTFSPEEVERLRPRVLDMISQIPEQWRSDLQAYFASRFFTASPYRMLPLGSADAVRRLDSEALAAFYHRYMAGPNAVMAIVGDVDEAKAEALVRKLFASMPAAAPERPKIAAEAPIARPTLYIKQSPPTRGAAGIFIGFRGMDFTDTRDRYPMAVLDTIISGYGYPSGWLQDSLRGGSRNLVYEVHAMNVMGIEPGYFGAYAACQPDHVNEVYSIMTEQFDKARAGRFADDEFRRAKGVILTSDLLRTQTHEDRASQMALDELYGLGYDFGDKLAERVNAVTLDDVRRVAREYLTQPIVTIVTPKPQDVHIGIEPTAIDKAPSEPAEPKAAAAPAGGTGGRS